MSGSRVESRKRFSLGVAVFVLLVSTMAVSAEAQADGVDIEIPIATVVRGPRGSVTVLSTTSTPAHLIGATCSVFVRTENQSSVHPGNDLLVESETSIILEDVEASPGEVVTSSTTMVLSDTIVVSLIMGPDAFFSAGFDVSVDCLPVDTTSSTTTTSEDTASTDETTTTEATTSTEATTTTVEVSDSEQTTTSEASTTTAGDEGADAETSDTTDTTVGTDVSDTNEESAGANDSSDTSIEDEVLDVTVLPFTGLADDGFGMLGLALVSAGLMLLAVGRGVEKP